MDADTRHQLKQNELAEFLANLRNLGKREFLTYLGVIVVVILAIAAYRYTRYRQVQRLVAATQALQRINVSDPELGDAPLANLRTLIADYAGTPVEALARVKLAEGLEVRGKQAGNDELLRQAARELEAVLKLPDVPHQVRAGAEYRLGIVYESLREFDKAREHLEKLSQDAAYAGTSFPELAEIRLENLDDYAQPVKFEPGPKPPPELEAPATRPGGQTAIQAAPAPATRPSTTNVKPSE